MLNHFLLKSIISVISRQCESGYEELCAIERIKLKSELLLAVGLESANL